MENQILGNRYELIEKIGGGGMALVYKAKCRLLNRFVAVKILRPEFTNDEEFVKRFLIEAQSAASLSHPNIVSIYDVGNDGSIHYIVMEYIDGITLKEYIDSKGHLKWKEAVNIEIQICSAIEHAHRNHIIHRDIKPHNILLTKEGIAKVTDFGIARAVSSSTITMVGSTIGSVHYFSPEQARGGFIDEKSDLYSLGIALYEMVTGRLPFDGETPVAIALKHIQVEATPPLEIKNDLPEGVNDIIMKAIKKDQNKRYQTATDLLEDLYRVLQEPAGGFVTINDTGDSPTRRIKAIGEENLNRREDLLIKDKELKKGNKKSEKMTVWLAIITSAVLITLFCIIGYKLVIPAITPDKVDTSFKTEDYVGKDISIVKAELSKNGVLVKENEEFNENVDRGLITSQDIGPDKPLKTGATITLGVSKGPELIKLDNYKNKDHRDVEDILDSMGLIPNTVEEFSEDVGIDLVIRTDPDMNAEVKIGETVTVYVSKGPELKIVKVPNLIGMTQTEATKAILDAKLKIGKIPDGGSNFTDKVSNQTPAAGTLVDEQSAVDIYFVAQSSPRKNQIVLIPLQNPDAYLDQITVTIEIIPTDTNVMEKLKDNEIINKGDFPLNIQVPVPTLGSTLVNVYLNGNPVQSIIVKP